MTKISAVVLTKNEEDRIEKCLQSLQWVDEVVVFDSGSTDKTLEIAKTFDNVKVFVEPGWEGFGKQRQISKNVATGEWIFMVDADEVIPDTLRDEIKTKLAEGNLNKAYAIPRKVWVFGKLLKYCWYPDYVVRLYAKEKSHYKSEDLVHEKVYLDNGVKVKKLTSPLLHFTYRDLDHFFEKSNVYTKAWAEKYFRAGKRTNLFQAVWHATCCFIKNYFVKLGFLDGKYGFLIAVLCTHSTFNKYACLLVKQWKKDRF